METPPVVSVEALSYFYPSGARAALLNVGLQVRAGEILGVLGANGSGKSTLCLAMNGIVPQLYGGRFFGSATVADLDTADQPIHAFARHVGIVLQDPGSQLIAASAENEVAFALENACVPRGEIRRRVAEALVAVDLAGLGNRHPHELSGGQQQRLALAVALAQQPALIVLDEPTAQLDPRAAREVIALIKRINRERGTAFVIASHASEEIADTAHRVVVLSRGRVCASGTPEAIFRDTALLARERVRPPGVTASFERLRSRGLFHGALPVRMDEALGALGALPPCRPFLPGDPAPAAGRPALALRGVSHAYPDGTRSLREVDLEIHSGDYVVLLGQNGSGKSTLLKHFLGLLRPAQGTVEVAGKPLSGQSMSAVARRIGYVGQNPDRQIFNATVEAEVAFGLGRLALSRTERQARTDAALASLGLSDLRGAHPLALSKGERARVVVAAVLAMEPEVLIFDEPTHGQDDAGARAILELTAALNRQGRTVIVATHQLHLMPGYARRAVVLAQGRVVASAPLREVYHDLALLGSTHLEPPQAAALAAAACRGSRAVTPEEFADGYAGGGP